MSESLFREVTCPDCQGKGWVTPSAEPDDPMPCRTCAKKGHLYEPLSHDEYAPAADLEAVRAVLIRAHAYLSRTNGAQHTTREVLGIVEDAEAVLAQTQVRSGEVSGGLEVDHNRRRNMRLILAYTPTDDELKQAIEIRFANCFPAMNIANDFAGRQTTVWKLARLNAVGLIREALARGLPLDTYQGAVEHEPIINSKLYAAVMRIIGEEVVVE